ncbi:translation initiation factor IF-2 [Paenibacillus sacheonensis]|uniref:Translation initiation factor IF-2 n=1 Tax=Paenibacillus sacheonensis TaxID=742054 RepID=A0A7X5BY18_9BACL|nr:translation initiation factor IF-2 [Paenibacillus sacheonensis]MBM7564656.1 translation initiation factor IF-2 [Paenibacillus sacheonensis]NBC69212.1 translation initiation factor IF-2 [Paenibacillus sacheonensis]
MTKQQDKDNKDKLRVYEYAKSLSMSSKEIITILKRLNLPVNNHMSVMENEMVSKVEGFFRDIKANAAAKRAQENATVSAAQSSGRPQQGQQERKPQPTLNASVQQGQGNKNPIEKQGNTTITHTNAPTNTSTTTAASSANSTTSQAPASSSASSTPASSASSQGTENRTNQPSQGQGSQNGRPQGQGSGYQGNRPQGQGSGYQGSRPQGQGGGYQGNRPQGQGGSGQGSRPQGQGTGYQGNRPQGQGTGYQGSRPQGQGGSGQGGYQGNRPAGGTGSSQGGQSSRPQGQGGGYQGNRPAGGGQGGYQGNRPAGGGTGGGQGGFRSSAPAQGGQSSNRGGSSPAPARTFDNNRPASDDRRRNNPKASNNTYGGNKRFEDNNRSGNFRNNNRGGKNNRKGGQQQERREKVDNTPKKIIVRGTVTVGDLAKLLHKDASEVIKKLIMLGVMATINQEVDLDTVQLIASEYGVEVEVKIPVEEDQFETFEEKDEEELLEARPPVVTIMGHVDHGKTTLLDSIRQTSVTSGEAGGITQHIGAYQVEINHKKITFLDTPGHEAFTLMRARGAQVTDITIIVVAADDGVMPQTVEAINHAKAANVPIIVAVNKIDKPGSDPDKIKQSLTEYGLVPEEWGGDTIFVNVSAKQRIGLEELLEMILLVAEMNDYKANPNKRARGTVIEAELDKGKGPVARILVQHGTLKIGDAFVAGNCFGRVRAMVNDKGRRLKEAGPSTPIEITGLTEVPQAGDPFLVFEDERKARAIADRRAIKHRQTELGANSRVTLEDLYNHIKDGEIKDLNVIIKADVQGSSEALKGSLAKIDIEGVRVKIIHSGAGAITESDINLAAASSAIVIGFNVRPEPQALATAEQEKVDIRLHSIIYNVIDEIEHAMKGMLDPVFKEVIIGQAEVRNLFKVTKVGVIAGCMVTSGKITRNAKARLIRSSVVVFEGEIESLKRFKDDAKEVAQGYECGITLDKFNDLKEGDVIEAFIMESVER